MSGIFVAGVGKYVPDKIVTNDDMSKIVETSDEWISGRTGIRERRFSQGEPVWYMGAQAAKTAIKDAGVDAGEIDMIIGTSVTADYFFPSLACIVQDETGAENAFCWDLSAACSGFVYALDVAKNYLETGRAKTVLIVSSEMNSRITDFTDRSSCVLFGDGAGAVVLKKDENKVFASYMKSEGRLGGAVISRAAENNSPYATDKDNALYQKYESSKDHYILMAGKDVYRFAVRALPEAISRACEIAGWQLSDLSVIIPHQANLRIIETAMHKLGIGLENVYVNLDHYGNTSSASIPMCLEELARQGRLKRGDKIVMSGFGGGLTYGAIAMEW